MHSPPSFLQGSLSAPQPAPAALPVRSRATPVSAPPPVAAAFPAPRRLPPLDMKLLAELPTLELRTRYLMEGFLNGKHRSPQRGSSVEFAEYRNYQFGDDPRRVDWRLFGRTERLHVRQYEAETQLRVFLVLDASASMDFSSRPGALSKIEFARLLVAGVAALAQREGDAFGFGLAGLELKDFMRARSSVPHWRAFVGRLELVVAAGATALATTLESLADIIPARSMVFVASDFYEEPERMKAALQRLRYDHHETVGLQVLDPFELEFDLELAGTYIDAETGSRLKLDAASARDGYLKRFGEFCTTLGETFHETGGDLVRLRTDESPVAALAQYLALRNQRAR